jgi:hypothetical protein
MIDIIIISLFCNGINLIMSDGFILNPIKLYADRNCPKWLRWLYTPIFGCVVCMASFWGSIGYVLIHPIGKDYPVIIVCVAFLNLFTNQLLNKIEL